MFEANSYMRAYPVNTPDAAKSRFFGQIGGKTAERSSTTAGNRTDVQLNAMKTAQGLLWVC